MSMPDKLVMKNVINVGNQMRNFRDCALLLKYACLFVGTEVDLFLPNFMVQNVSVYLQYLTYLAKYPNVRLMGC